MSDLNSRIEAAKQEVTSLKQQIVEAQKSQRDQTLPAAVRAKGDLVPAAIRTPPSTKCRRTLKGHFGKVTALHWGGDSRTVVSASQDGNLLLWNAVTSNKLQSIALKSSYVMSVGMEQSQGNLIACGGLDNLCTVYNLNRPDNAMEMASHDGFLSCCRFLSEGEMITSSGDSTCILWDILKATPVSTFAEHGADAMFVSIKPGDPSVFVSCSVDRTAKVWDVRQPDASVQTFLGHAADVNGVEFLPSDSNCFATCGQDNTVRLFDMRAYNELACFGTPAPQPEASAATGGGDEETAPAEGFTSLAVSRSGRVLFCGHTDGSVIAYDALSEKTTQPVFAIQAAHERHVSCIGVSPNGEALCSGSWDGNLKIWA